MYTHIKRVPDTKQQHLSPTQSFDYSMSGVRRVLLVAKQGHQSYSTHFSY
jgi:hypothetical protein